MVTFNDKNLNTWYRRSGTRLAAGRMKYGRTRERAEAVKAARPQRLPFKGAPQIAGDAARIAQRPERTDIGQRPEIRELPQEPEEMGLLGKALTQPKVAWTLDRLGDFGQGTVGAVHGATKDVVEGAQAIGEGRFGEFAEERQQERKDIMKERPGQTAAYGLLFPWLMDPNAQKAMAEDFSIRDLSRGEDETIPEKILGTGADYLLDPTLAVPGGLGTKAAKVARVGAKPAFQALKSGKGVKEAGKILREADEVVELAKEAKQVQKIAKRQAKKGQITEGVSKETIEYLDKLKVDRQKALRQGRTGAAAKARKAVATTKRVMVDKYAPIEDTLLQWKRTTGGTIRPSQDINQKIAAVLRSDNLTADFIERHGLYDVMREVPDQVEFDEYLTARHALETTTETGRDLAADKKLVDDLGGVYEPFAAQIDSYTRDLLKLAEDSGIISKKSAENMRKSYKHYIPLKRVMEDVDDAALAITKRQQPSSIASIASQTVFKGRKGSQRKIQSPIESLLEQTDLLHRQVTKNDAAKTLASYKKLKGNPFQMEEVARAGKPKYIDGHKYMPEVGQIGDDTIAYMEDGVTKYMRTTPEVATAAKNLNAVQFGTLAKIALVPIRIAKAGITGMNPTFALANIAKDQVTRLINSPTRGFANPKVFMKGAAEAVGHGKIYKEWMRNAGGGTSFDMFRNAPRLTVEKARARGFKGKAKFIAKNPSELFRHAENLVSRSEEATRLTQYMRSKDYALKQGMSKVDAEAFAARASREATVDFARAGEFGQVLNVMMLYFNAGIQGSRTFVRSLRERPGRTAARIAVTSMMPMAAITSWNIADPQRKAAYDDIPDWEKENNFIIIPPNPTQDEDGKWNVIKVPISQEVASILVPLRMGLESFSGYSGPGAKDLARAFIGATTGQDIENLGSTLIAQQMKPGLQYYQGVDYFTDAPTIPEYLTDPVSGKPIPSHMLPPEMQTRPDTSGTAQQLGRVFNQSPLKIQKLVKDIAGGLGEHALHYTDRAQAAAGTIPEEQIGGRSFSEAMKKRFSTAKGESLDSVIREVKQKGKPIEKGDYVVYLDEYGQVQVKYKK